ncbi:hypothetical protein CEXT_754821 [Caerostris extrusa]|uniref:Uncharacterized protein n=1 Tax=Caerostris extrusa TaxID=172846 RepID=A0AAV4XD25_CAEEX|nr:hypothetical protein CEXT_754821 [Caerostris extrusa]
MDGTVVSRGRDPFPSESSRRHSNCKWRCKPFSLYINCETRTLWDFGRFALIYADQDQRGSGGWERLLLDRDRYAYPQENI